MLSRGKLSQIKTAFIRVYDVADVEEMDLVRYGNEILFHASPFPFESDSLMGFRLASIHSLEDSDVIMEYLSKIPEDAFVFTQMSTYGKLFEIGKALNIGYQGGGSTTGPSTIPPVDIPKSVQEEVPVVHERPEVPVTPEVPSGSTSVDNYMNIDDIPGMEQSESPHGTKQGESINVGVNTETINTNTYTNSKEEIKMSNAIEKLAQEANAVGVGSAVSSNVAEVSKNDKAAARKVIEASQTDRMNYSKNAKVKQVLVVAIPREKKAVKGRAAMGTISKPQKAFEKFVSVTGCTVEDGVVKFSKLHSSQLYDDALKMYQLLEQAKQDPSTTVKPYFGKETEDVPTSIKGIKVEDPSGKVIMLSQKEIAQHILKYGFLYLDVASKCHAQFQLDAAQSRAGSTPKKSYVVKIANKKDLLEEQDVCIPVKVLTTEVDEEGSKGFKSELAVMCVSNKMDSNGNPKKITWRIPLDVEQYKVEIVDGYNDLFKTIGNQTKPISLDSPEDIAKAIDRISDILASENTKSGKESIVPKEITDKINEEKTKLVAAEAAAVNATLGAQVDVDEFEG